MSERIIPIQIEESESNGSDDGSSQKSPTLLPLPVPDESYHANKSATNYNGKVSKPQLKKQIHIKPASEDKRLSKFSVFQKRADYSGLAVPNADTIEKIVLVIDRGQDDEFSPFASKNGNYAPFSMMKRAVNIFISLKHGINPHHEFAIVALNVNDASLLLQFTSDLRKLKDCINKITECKTEDRFNMNSVFDIIEDLVKLPPNIAPEIEPPYVLRTIIFYGRSYTIPELDITEDIDEYLSNKYFTCDILMTHEPVEISNNCDKIFGILQDFDTKGNAYFFPVGRDIKKLHKSTARLLAHPLQRPIQTVEE